MADDLTIEEIAELKRNLLPANASLSDLQDADFQWRLERAFALARAQIEGREAGGELVERLHAWGGNSPDPDFFQGDALSAVLGDCASAADALASMRAENERLAKLRASSANARNKLVDEVVRLRAQRDETVEALRESDWRSPHEMPGSCGAVAIRVLVKLERIENPPELNAPPKYGFGHRIMPANPSDHWPADGWFFDGQDEDYRVTAWRYIDPPERANAALNTLTTGEQKDA